MSPVFGHGRLRLYLLKLLDEAPRHGYEVIRLLQDRFMGVYAPSPGTIYPRLARLEEEGFLTHDEEDGRKIYRITDKGREEINRRMDELDELEREITESVSGIAREVKEDVRETVRSLREELTWTTRDMRSQKRPAHERARAAREAARDRARQAREEMRQARDEAREHAGQAGGEGRRGWDWDWADWQDWADWTDWPGRRRRAGRDRDRDQDRDRDRPGADRSFESLAREFGNELRQAVRQAGALGEGAVEQLRGILEDALERIRTDVFGPAKPPHGEEEPEAQPGEATGQDAWSKAASEQAADRSSRGEDAPSPGGSE